MKKANLDFDWEILQFHCESYWTINKLFFTRYVDQNRFQDILR